MDRGETVDTAAAREVEEETGLKVRPVRLFGLYSYPADPVAVAIYETEILGGKPQLTEECLEIRYFDPSAIPFADLAFPSAVDSLRALIARES